MQTNPLTAKQPGKASKPKAAVTVNIPLFEWNKAFKKHFYRSKFGGCKQSAQVLEALLLKGFQVALQKSVSPQSPYVVVVPIPARAGNPRRVEGMAQRLAWELGWQCQPSALHWQKQTLRQHQLHQRKQRFTNVKGALGLQEKLPTNATIVVIDDLSTTGATLQEAVRALRTQHSGLCYTVSLGYVPKQKPFTSRLLQPAIAHSLPYTLSAGTLSLDPMFSLLKMWDGTDDQLVTTSNLLSSYVRAGESAQL